MDTTTTIEQPPQSKGYIIAVIICIVVGISSGKSS